MRSVRVIKIDDDQHPEQNSIRVLEQNSERMGLAGRVRSTQVVLAKYLQHAFEENWKGKRVADFWCGTGVVGLLIERQGAQVFFSDSEHSQELVKQNIKTNNSKGQHLGIDKLPLPLDYYIFAGLSEERLQKVTAILRESPPREESFISFKEEETGQQLRWVDRFQTVGLSVQVVPGEEQAPLFRDDRVKIICIRGKVTQ